MNNELEIRGKVIHGDDFGKQLGFPTANLDRRDYVRRKLNLRFGVYAGWAQLNSKKHRAAIVIGPLDKYHLPKLEAHLLNFRGNLYGKKLVIYIERFLRPWKKVKSIEELKKMISKDIITIKKMKL